MYALGTYALVGTLTGSLHGCLESCDDFSIADKARVWLLQRRDGLRQANPLPLR